MRGRRYIIAAFLYADEGGLDRDGDRCGGARRTGLEGVFSGKRTRSATTFESPTDADACADASEGGGFTFGF